jgi:hypothetical protein
MKRKLQRSLARTGTALDAITKLVDTLDGAPAGQVRHVARIRDHVGEASAGHALTKGLIDQLVALGKVPDDIEAQGDYADVIDRPDDSTPKSARLPADADKFVKLIERGGHAVSGPDGLFRSPSWPRR